MGIINVTPDSFSDGGRFEAPIAARDHAQALVDAGADLLDVGGESTRPGALAVSVDEECARVLPAVEAIAAAVDVPISIDTRNATVAQRALDAGAHVVNDVSALTHDPRMAHVVAESGAGVVLMHMNGTPETMQHRPHYDDVIEAVETFFRERLQHCRTIGIDEDRVVIDPGIGFGKRLEDNLALLAHGDRLLELGRPVLIGASRKSMFGQLLGADVDERVIPTAAATAISAFLGASIVRVHDVHECKWAAEVGNAVRRARGHRTPAEVT
jgi:dihydropteroate synthase